MQRLFNLSKWRRLCEGQTIRFDSARPRVVRVEANAPRATGLYLFEPETGEALFLARVEGRDTLEFYTGGAFSLVSDGEVYIYTADGETIHNEVVDPEIFTRITERRQINPEIRRIQEMMNLNIERRLAAQRDEFNAVIRAIQRDKAMAARRAADLPVEPAESGDGGGDEAPPKPESGATADATPPSPGERGKRGKRDS